MWGYFGLDVWFQCVDWFSLVGLVWLLVQVFGIVSCWVVELGVCGSEWYGVLYCGWLFFG